MIIPIILILIFLILIIVALINYRTDEPGTLLFTAFLMLLPLVISIMIHTSELALLRKGNALVVIREQAINDIDTQLLQIKVSNSSLMNADSPIRSLVETRTKFISELTEQKIKIQEAKISIEDRSIGIMKMVVWIYGKE